MGGGGSIGVAAASPFLSGEDSASSTPSPLFNGASAVSAGADTTAVLANLEAGVAVKLMPPATLRGFAGLNYDGRVPGIAGPSYAGSILAPSATTAAAIFFACETSYYAGVGVLVAFDRPVYAKY